MRVYLNKKDLSIISFALDSLEMSYGDRDESCPQPVYDEIQSILDKLRHNKDLTEAAKARAKARIPKSIWREFRPSKA